MPTNRELKQDVINRLKKLDMEFNEHEAYFKEIADFIMPDAGWFKSRADKPNTNVRRYEKITDDTAIRANEICGAGMQGGLTSPARPWFKLGLLDPGREDIDQNRQWLDQVERTMYNVFAGSNFYTAIHAIYEEVVAFNTAAMFGMQDSEDLVNFTPLTAGEYRILCSRRGQPVDTLYRYDQMTAAALVKEFGPENCSRKVKNLVEPGKSKNPFEWIQIAHCIMPNYSRDVSKIDNTNMPWQSVWWEVGGERDDLLLRNSGYIQKNFFVPRWKVSGPTPYGSGPGKQALGTTKMLQEIQKTGIMALHKEVAPPMKAPIGMKGRVNLMPDAVTWYTKLDPDSIGPLYQLAMNIQNLEFKIQSVQAMLEKTFYNDLFMLITQRPDMTATEVMERHEEKLLMLGPTIERQIHDLLDPCIDWVFHVMERNDLLPPPPQELQDRPLKIEYVSLLAQAQKLVTGRAIESVIGLVTAVTQIDQGARHKIDYDRAIDRYTTIVGAPVEILRPDEEAKQIRAEEAQALANERQMQQAMNMAKTGKDLSGAQFEDGSSALDSVAQELGV